MTCAGKEWVMPMAFSRLIRLTVSWPLTIEPRMATPATAPSSRLVLVADAAMPECSPGTEDRADEVTGTMAMPNPIPAMASVQPTADKPACGEILKSVSKMPTPAIQQPLAMEDFGPQG